jgi:hypothetical protein
MQRAHQFLLLTVFLSAAFSARAQTGLPDGPGREAVRAALVHLRGGDGAAGIWQEGCR